MPGLDGIKEFLMDGSRQTTDMKWTLLIEEQAGNTGELTREISGKKERILRNWKRQWCKLEGGERL